MDKPTRPLLVAVTDRIRLKLPMSEWAMRVIEGGADIIQLREKDLSEDELRPIAIAILNSIDSPGFLQINGFPRLALELGCGLHLPESIPTVDNPPPPFSRSVHSPESISSLMNPDFLVAGHVFPTRSKAGVPSRGVDWLRSMALASPFSVVAIGGIDASNAALAIHAGADGVALIGALVDTAEPCDRASEIRSVIDREWMLR